VEEEVNYQLSTRETVPEILRDQSEDVMRVVLASACTGYACNLYASAASAVPRCSVCLAYCGLLTHSLVLSFLLHQFAAPFLQHIPCT
jgi:hypothetical protein